MASAKAGAEPDSGALRNLHYLTLIYGSADVTSLVTPFPMVGAFAVGHYAKVRIA